MGLSISKLFNKKNSYKLPPQQMITRERKVISEDNQKHSLIFTFSQEDIKLSEKGLLYDVKKRIN